MGQPTLHTHRCGVFAGLTHILLPGALNCEGPILRVYFRSRFSELRVRTDGRGKGRPIILHQVCRAPSVPPTGPDASALLTPSERDGGASAVSTERGR